MQCNTENTTKNAASQNAPPLTQNFHLNLGVIVNCMTVSRPRQNPSKFMSFDKNREIKSVALNTHLT